MVKQTELVGMKMERMKTVDMLKKLNRGYLKLYAEGREPEAYFRRHKRIERLINKIECEFLLTEQTIPAAVEVVSDRDYE